MESQPADQTPEQGAGRSAADKIEAAAQLLQSAFQDAHTDSSSLSKAQLLEQIAATQRLTNITWAVQSARLAQVAAADEVLVPDSTSPDGVREHLVRHPIGSHQEEFIGSEIGPLLGWSPRQATGRVTEATDVIIRTPRLFARVGTGELEPGKLASIHRAMGRVMRWRDEDTEGDLGADLAGAVENGLLGDPDNPDGPEPGSPEFAALEQAKVDVLVRSTSAHAAHRTTRILATLDPVAADKAATVGAGSGSASSPTPTTNPASPTCTPTSPVMSPPKSWPRSTNTPASCTPTPPPTRHWRNAAPTPWPT